MAVMVVRVRSGSAAGPVGMPGCSVMAARVGPVGPGTRASPGGLVGVGAPVGCWVGSAGTAGPVGSAG
ncbi:hypothetical protein MBOU_37940 [Mycobacterium bourgelatii]|uniref:Uncharacterized protein n=1 Tax=Mycobacterium bourgelatii TaxID=1273442 RepID=A0A7I9YT87_MYCBU|nr:hypothetical protein MBOU_37940 [Mycobacterium bourgelatii]